MSHCMVLWCKNKGHIPGISYFGLTKSRHDVWMKALGRDPNIEHLGPRNTVCSEHFTDENKISKNKSLRLKANAVPTLKLRKRDASVPGNQRYIESSADQLPRVVKEPPSVIVEEKEEQKKKSWLVCRKDLF